MFLAVTKIQPVFDPRYRWLTAAAPPCAGAARKNC